MQFNKIINLEINPLSIKKKFPVLWCLSFFSLKFLFFIDIPKKSQRKNFFFLNFLSFLLCHLFFCQIFVLNHWKKFFLFWNFESLNIGKSCLQGVKEVILSQRDFFLTKGWFLRSKLQKWPSKSVISTVSCSFIGRLLIP